jgi:uncharacterized alpha/beta hydrolase family protein
VAQTNRKVLENRPNIIIIIIIMVVVVIIIIIMKTENTNTDRYDNTSNQEYHTKRSRKGMKENTRVYI